MSQQEFEDVVGDALDRIPADLAEVMDNVVVLVQDEPDPEMLTEEDYDDSGLPTLLGLYDGVPLTERDEAGERSGSGLSLTRPGWLRPHGCTPARLRLVFSGIFSIAFARMCVRLHLS